MYRRYTVPSMWKEMDRLQREMNRLFRTPHSPRLYSAPGFPALNIWTSDESQWVTAEIPGVEPEEIEISVTGEVLTLSGSRKPENISEDVRYHRQERGHGKFKRSIQLPFPVKSDQVEAIFKNGLLSIRLPRAEEDKPKKIAVKTF